MTEWLKLMLEEIRRKQGARENALRERERRASAPKAKGAADDGGRKSAGSAARD